VWAARCEEGEAVVRLGRGSYAVKLPPGAKEPQARIFKTAQYKGPVPTGDWWSSLAWVPFSEAQYAHPLALRAEKAGLRVYYASAIRGDKIGVFGMMAGGQEDLVLGHSAQAEFPEARLQSASDWFVTAAFGADGKGFQVSYGHGSPFVYAVFEGGEPKLTFPKPPQVWAGDARSPVLGLTIAGKPYALFGPAGATWDGVGGKVLTCQTQGKPYFSLALLPDATPKTLELFRRYAYAHVTDTKVEWAYDEKTSAVTTRFTFTTKPFEGQERGTLFALYPHQWTRADSGDSMDVHAVPGISPKYVSVRGDLKLAQGASFTTRSVFPGVLWALPDQGTYDRKVLAQLVEQDANAPAGPVKDTYWEGKQLGKLAALAPIAEQVGAQASRDKLLAEIKRRLEGWFSAADAQGRLKTKGLFYLNRNWGSLIGYPGSYGSDTELSDHHFHYGYFIRAAAEIARHDPAWASPEQWGGVLRLLIRDIASPDRSDPEFPFLRAFDPYAGHSWASGRAVFADGNNQESSSEAMNAWTALILLGDATGDRALRDLGIYLYTTEMEAIHAYWFDVLGAHRPPAYTPAVVTMVWGGKGVNETWFTKNPEAVHGINWLPIHGGSLYLGLYPAYVRKNYQALVAENQGENWDEWADIVLMYRALDDPADALRQYNLNPGKLPMEAGNSKANLYHWLHNLAALGQVDRTTTADCPLYAVFRKETRKTYVVYNGSDRRRTVTFSDGTALVAEGRGFAVKQAEAVGAAKPAP
jgi:endoglucanase Acf2